VAAHINPNGDDALMRELRKQARMMPPLGDAEQAGLLEKSVRGDRTSQERLVAANLGLVIRLAEARDEKGLSVPDLIQEGSLGLFEAVRSFATSHEPDFARFAEHKIGEQMDAAIAAEAAAVRDAELLVTAASDYERTEVLLHRTLGHGPTAAQIAEQLEWTVERTQYVARVVAEARRRHDEELLEFIDTDAGASEIDDALDA
jgi:DNA-directed RNA polymerase sigma subunit (sigma70/sigma32)